MSDNLTNRVKRIIAGSAGAMVSAIEDLSPEMIMEQAIQEVDSAKEDVRVELGKTIAAGRLAAKRFEESEDQYHELNESIQLATKQGRDDLARAGIERQLDIEAQFKILQSSVDDYAKQIEELEGFIDALEAKKREMKRELVEYRKEAAKLKAAEDSGIPGADRRITAHVKAERASSAFDRMMHRQLGLPAHEDSPQNTKQLAELSELSRNNKIEERLAKIKALPEMKQEQLKE